MFKKISIGLLAVLVLFFATSYFFYLSFRTEQLAYLNENSRIAQTSAGKIEYQLIGDDGPFVLFLHGTPGGYDQGITMEGARVLTPSRPGYLRTPLEVGRTPEEQASAYAALLDTLEIDKVVVTGASGGGPSAIAFAAAYPDRTAALIAIEAVSQAMPEDRPGLPPFMQTDYLLWATLSLMSLGGPEALVGMLVPDPTNRKLIAKNNETTEKFEQLVWSIWPISLRRVGLENDTIQFENLNLPSEQVTVPTFIIHGTEDINVPISHSETLAGQIPNSTFHVVEGADHMMPLSHAQEVDAATARFIAELQPE